MYLSYNREEKKKLEEAFANNWYTDRVVAAQQRRT